MKIGIGTLAIIASSIFTSSASVAQNPALSIIPQQLPSSLEFLKDLHFQPALQNAITGDIQSLPAPNARESILARLRLDQISAGALPNSVLTNILPPGEPVSVALANLRARARDPAPLANNAAFLSALPDGDVIRVEQIRRQNFITNGFVPALPLGLTSVIPAGLSTSERNTPQIIRGYRRVSLTTAQCAPPPSEIRAHSCSSEGGPDCPGFDPSRFAGVAEVNFGSDGGVCTGTLIAQNWVITAAHCFLGPGLSQPALSTREALQLGGAGPQVEGMSSLNLERFVSERDASIRFPNFSESSSRPITSVITHPDYNPANDQLPSSGPLNDLALVQFASSKVLDKLLIDSRALPMSIPSSSYSGAITILGFGISESSAVASRQVNLTWPEADVVAGDGRLIIKKQTIRTFCRGDSGGPALLGLQRGCQTEPNPMTVVGVISYHGGVAEDAQGCKTSPVSDFTDIGLVSNRTFVCKATSNAVLGCR